MFRYIVVRVASLIVLFSLTALPVLAQAPDLAAAAAWLQARQASDGGFGDGFSEGSSLAATAETIIAAAAAGQDVSAWGDPSPLDYLAAQVPTLNQTGALGKTILAVKAVGVDPHSFAGHDLVAKLRATYDADSGAFQGLVNDHAFGMLAMKAAGVELPTKVAETLEGLQAEDGGWSFDASSQSDTNTTAIAIQALLAAGRGPESKPIQDALAFLKTQQNEDGGFPYAKPSEFGTATDANSTAYVIQALLASGEDLAAWNNPQNTLAAFQLPEGAFEYKQGEGANFLATVQALPALAGNTMLALSQVEVSQPPAVPAAQATATPAATTTAPTTLPTTGGAGANGLVLVLAGLALVLGARFVLAAR